MSAYAESVASFKRRCKEIGLSQGETASLEAQNIKSFNNLAFAVCVDNLDNLTVPVLHN